MSDHCPICNFQLKNDTSQNRPKTGDSYYTNCQRCGEFYLSRRLKDDLPSYTMDQKKIATASYNIQKMQNSNKPPLITTYVFDNILKNPLPDLSEQINNFILWIGANTNLGETFSVDSSIHQFVIGVISPEGFIKILEHLKETKIFDVKLIAGIPGHYLANVSLSIEGWNQYHQLKRGATSSRKVFMAMKYGDPELDKIVDQQFRPAVEATGFSLFRLDNTPKAGLIDDYLRVEISNSLFLISDLTHENAGAYWEAGFAEGLGKSVIYTCEKEKFEKEKSHFDTNHHLTVVWDKEKPEEAIEQLKATIRATFPDKAKLTDD